MEDIISACATTLFDCSIAVIGRQFGYLCNYSKNVDSLNDQILRLDAKRADKSHSVTIAQRNAEKIRRETSNWQEKADRISEGARKFIEECEEKRKMRCVMGLCPNPVSLYRFSRRACKKKVDIEEAIAESEQMLKDSDPAVGLGKGIALSTEGLLAFESRKSILENIMEALQDETTKSIGVYGFGGMGKTTLAKQVAARADEGNMFEDIVFAPVTQKVELKEIQEKIGSMLDLKLKGCTEAESAGRIFERLKGKKVLVILDDLWTEIDLKKLGVSFGAEHIGCKILLTSRFRHVLTSMGTEKDFNLGALEEEEAWKLFEEKTGNVLKNSDFRNIGKKVAKRCQGLPVLIVTVSASLSKRPKLPAWNDALNQLKNMNHKEMHDIVNSAIESISFNHLQKTHKQLFLLCGIIGGVASVEELLQYSWGLNLFDEEAGTIQKARDRLQTLIIDLKESCLLLDDVDSTDSIKMHDVVRDVAISIGRKVLNMFSTSEHDVELSIWRKDDDLKSCTAMVLLLCPELPGLPSYLECPSLELFVMSGFSRMFTSPPSIPQTFFEKTNKLKVLGMSNLNFVALPPSLSFLKNLQTLRVKDCFKLKDISLVGELKKLQTLSLGGPRIIELPSGIGKLPELRSLDVRGCFKLKVIPVGLIEGLTRLEELYVSRDFNSWEVEVRVNGSLKINASLRELKHLPNLCGLEIRVGDVKLLPEDLHFEKFERYVIVLGDMWDINRRWGFHKLGVTRKIGLQLSSTSINHLQHEVKRLFESTECLWLGELKGIENVTPALDVDGFPILKHLLIQKDYEIQYIVNVDDKQHNVAFPCLELLHLIHLVKLQKICYGLLMEGSFRNLTSVKVEKCHGLKSLFSYSMASGLPRLQKIKVFSCDALEAVIAEKNMNDDGVNIDDGVCKEIEFAQLRKLSLKRLPKLKNFFSNGEMLPLQNQSQKSLHDPEIHTEDEEEDELKSSLTFFTKVSFPKLEELYLSGISSLKYMLTPSIATGLVGLKSLNVRNCSGMKHLIVAEEEGETNIETITFPQLKSICLEELPNLTTFYSVMGSNENLDTTAQHLFSEKVSFPKLEELELCEISNLTEIWSHKIQEISCCKLKIWSCKSLKHVFPSCVAQSLNKLESLKVGDCEVMETIIGDENREEEIIKTIQKEHEHVSATFMFAKLTEVYLEKNPKLECFYSREHTVEYPALKDIYVDDCGKLSALDFLSSPEKQGDNLLEKVTSKLENFCIRNNDLMKILQLYHHFPAHLFSSLKELSIVEFRGGSIVFPSVSFKSLKTLIVEDCGGLTHLIQPSTAASLEQLHRLNISGCEMLENIIGDDNEESSRDDNEIIFNKLQYLYLEKLPRLTNFCSSPNYTFNFPKLTRVGLTECPNMKTFCGGITIAPWLSEVRYDGEDHWEGDVNTTVQKIFAEMEAKRLSTSLPSTSSSNHDHEANISVHENSFEELTEPIPTVVQICQNANNPEKESEVSDNSTESIKGTETCEQVVEEGKEVEFSDTTRHSDPSIHNDIAHEQPVAGSVAPSSKSSSHSEEFQRLTTSLPSTSSNSQFGPEAEIHEKTGEEPSKVADTHEEGKGKEIVVFGEAVAQHVVPSSLKLGLGTEVEAIAIAPSNSRQKDFKGVCVPRSSIPLDEFVQILQTRPVNNVSAEQVEFLEDAIGLFCTYVDKAKECLERKNAISELKRQMQALEDENEATASSAPRFG